MIFVKTFKGYEDKVMDLDDAVNEWLGKNAVDVVDVKACLAHEHESRSGSGDLIYTILYKADRPL